MKLSTLPILALFTGCSSGSGSGGDTTDYRVTELHGEEQTYAEEVDPFYLSGSAYSDFEEKEYRYQELWLISEGEQFSFTHYAEFRREDDGDCSEGFDLFDLGPASLSPDQNDSDWWLTLQVDASEFDCIEGSGELHCISSGIDSMVLVSDSYEGDADELRGVKSCGEP